eukprot:Hpha_TRINITY_DN30018_c0_g1::TRINITY_DN30018_c0_g1_i1::g.21560::m.21560
MVVFSGKPPPLFATTAALLAAVLPTVAQCPPATGTGSVLEKVDILGMKEFGALLQGTGVADAISSGGSFTLFAPNDASFWRLPRGYWLYLRGNSVDREQVLALHVVNQSLPRCALAADQTVVSMGGLTLFITARSGERIRVGRDGFSATVRTEDTAAENGFVHVTDMVLIPGAVQRRLPATPLLAAAAENGHSSFSAAAEASGLDSVLNNESWGGTCLLPPDSAFLASEVAGLARYPAELARVLSFHCSSVGLLGTELKRQGTLTTILGPDLTVGNIVNTSIVTVASADKVAELNVTDVFSTSGVGHSIDALLLPPNFTNPPADTRRTLGVRVSLHSNMYCAGEPSSQENWTVYTDGGFAECRQIGTRGYRLRALGCTESPAPWELAVFSNSTCTKELQNTSAATGASGVCMILGPQTSGTVQFFGVTAAELCTISQWEGVLAANVSIRRRVYAGPQCAGEPVVDTVRAWAAAAPVVPSGCGGNCVESSWGWCCSTCEGPSLYRRWDAGGFFSDVSGVMQYCAREQSYLDSDCTVAGASAELGGSPMWIPTGQCVRLPVDLLATTGVPASAGCSQQCAALSQGPLAPLASGCISLNGTCVEVATVYNTLEGIDSAALRTSLCVITRFKGTRGYDSQGVCLQHAGMTNGSCSMAEATAAELAAAATDSPTVSPSVSPTVFAPLEEDLGSGSGGGNSHVPPWAMITFGLSIGICAICLVQCSQRNRSKLAAVGDGARNVVHHSAIPPASRRLLEEPGDSSTESSEPEPPTPAIPPPYVAPSGVAQPPTSTPEIKLLPLAGRGAPPVDWAPGSRARLNGLHKRPELNGAQGTVVGLQNGMVIVDLEGQGTKAVRPKHLEPMDLEVP